MLPTWWQTVLKSVSNLSLNFPPFKMKQYFLSLFQHKPHLHNLKHSGQSSTHSEDGAQFCKSGILFGQHLTQPGSDFDKALKMLLWCENTPGVDDTLVIFSSGGCQNSWWTTALIPDSAQPGKGKGKCPSSTSCFQGLDWKNSASFFRVHCGCSRIEMKSKTVYKKWVWKFNKHDF